MEHRELVAILKSANSAEEINQRREEIGELIPAVKVMFDYDQQNHAHQFDLWMHSLNVVVNLPRNLGDDLLYLTALLSKGLQNSVFGCEAFTLLCGAYVTRLTIYGRFYLPFLLSNSRRTFVDIYVLLPKN